MSKGARLRAERRDEAASAVQRKTLFHGTAGATGAIVKARGMKPAERGGLLLCEAQEDARPHALAATSRLLIDGCEDRRGLLVEVDVPLARLRSDEDVPAHWWIGEVRPGEVARLHYFDPEPEEIADSIELAEVFDTDSQDWRRAATGEMGW
jgi:hypothetical protein